jgi:ribosomal protein S12 methylthiotransferase
LEILETSRPGKGPGKATGADANASAASTLADTIAAANANGRTPRVGFVSLGCPKALVDSERILTQLRTEGYEVTPEYDDADVVVVNTCGFIDDAVRESLDTIGEALAENGKVIVTGCL